MKQTIRLKKYILIAILFCVAYSANAQQNVVVHTVEEGQTLYSIARIYQVSPQQIKEQNPLINDDFVIKPGQVIRIKLENKQDEEVLPQIATMYKSPKIHIVQEKETLYGISKAYGVSLDDLKAWNNLGNNSLSIGQNLTVGWRYSNKKTDESAGTTITLTELVPQAVDETTKPAIQQAPAPVVEKPAFKITDKQAMLKRRYDVDAHNETINIKDGAAIWFNTDNRMLSSRYYALFSDAQIGSIVKVKSLISNQIVYVKVIGSLPDTAENHGAMIKLTPAAKKLLRSKDGKIRVEVKYIK